MHVTLINPPFIFTQYDIVSSQCLGIMYIAATLKDRGHRVTIIDALYEGRNKVVQLEAGSFKVGLTNKDTVIRIPRDSNIIGISVPFSHLAALSHSLIREIKKKFPRIPLVMGGVYPSSQYKLAIQSEADYIILGEGEIAMCELIDYIIEKRSNPMPSGVIAKANFHRAGNANSTHIHYLERLPFPARDLLPHTMTISQRSWVKVRTASIITSRGCPFDCNFCSVHPICGYKWRPRSSKDVLAEIDELVEKYKVYRLEIEDDNFTLNKDRTIEILNGILERNKRKKYKKISWSAPNGLRIDTLDRELMDIVARSNCTHINLALEHGDEEMLRIMNKSLDLSKVVEVVKLVRQFGISAHLFVIYGYPGETRKRFLNGTNFYLKLKKIAPKIKFIFLIAQPYPGTKLFDFCIKKGYLKKDIFNDINKIPRFSTEGLYLLETPEFDRQELIRRKRVSILLNADSLKLV